MGIFSVIVVLLVIISIVLFNRLIRLKNLMKEAWSGIDVQLKRRHDLIPPIVDTVKGYVQHERNVLESLTKLRAQTSGASDVKSQNEIEKGVSGALKNVFAVAENYPALKASENFLDLQHSLSDVEDQIQLARRYYNGTVRNYNVMVESFPSNLMAGALHFKSADYFEIEYATERATPDIQFSNK